MRCYGDEILDGRICHAGRTWGFCGPSCCADNSSKLTYTTLLLVKNVYCKGKRLVTLKRAKPSDVI